MAYARLTPFGAQVKKALIDKQMTQVELAGLLGVQSAYINHIITGRKSGAKYIPGICAVLDLDLPPPERKSA